MSDPVANVDIEDVLSSIRRLVSNGPDKGDDPSRDAHDAERLVLTPSQRIDAEAAEAAGEDETAGDTIAEINDDAVEHAPADLAGLQEAFPPEIDAPQRAAFAAPEDGSGIMSEPHAAPSDLVEECDDDSDGDMEAGTGTDMPASGDLDLDGIAEMFARHDAAAPSTWEPDGDDEDAFAEGADAPTLDWRDADVEAGEEAGYAQDEPDREKTEDHAAVFAHDWDSDVSGDEENAFAIEDEAVLDEEALRDLVAEIVREELMGTLGERITRNVRKLVRREIHRALNSQEFD